MVSFHVVTGQRAMEYSAFQHLAYHLFRARRWKDLGQLVLDFQWYHDSHIHDSNGTLFANDMQLSFQAARDAGPGGLAMLPALLLVSSQTSSSALPRLTLDGLECLVRLSPASADLVADHISQVMPPSKQSEAYLAVALALGASHQVQEAQAFAYHALEMVGDEWTDKALTCAKAGEVFALLGDNDKAIRLANTAADTLRSVGCLPDEGSAIVEAAVGSLLGRLGRHEEAQARLRLFAEHIQESAKKEESPESLSNLLMIGAALHHAGDSNLADTYLESALRSIERRSCPPRWLLSIWEPEYTRCLAKALQVLADTGQKERAKNLKPRLLSSTQFFVNSKREEHRNRVSILCSTALALEYLGDSAAARLVLRQAMNFAQSESVFEEGEPGVLWDYLRRMAKVEFRKASDPDLYHLPLVIAPYRIRYLALVQLAQELIISGDQEISRRVFKKLWCEASEKREKQGFLSRLEESLWRVSNSESGFLLCQLLDGLIRTGDPGLISWVVDQITHPTWNKTISSNLNGQISSCYDSESDGRIPRLGIAWEVRWWVVGRLVAVGSYEQAASVLYHCPIVRLSDPSVQTVMRELVLAGRFEEAVALVNRLSRPFFGCLIAMLCPLVLGMMALVLLVFPRVLGRVCFCGLVWGIVAAGVATLIGFWRKDSHGLSYMAKFLCDDYLYSIVEGLTRTGNLQAASEICKGISDSQSRGLATVCVVEAAASAADSHRLRAAVAELMELLERGVLEQEEGAKVLIALSAAVQREGPSLAVQLREAMTSCLELAAKIKRAPTRCSALVAVASCLFLSGDQDEAKRVLGDLLPLISNHLEIREQVLQRLAEARNLGSLRWLWELGGVTDLELARVLLKEEDPEVILALLPVLRRLPQFVTELMSDGGHFEALTQAVRVLKTRPEWIGVEASITEAFGLLAESDSLWGQERLESCPHIEAFAQLGRELDMDLTVLETVKLYMAALEARQVDYRAHTAGLYLAAFSRAAVAFSVLELPEARSLSIDALHRLFDLARATGRWENVWQATQGALPAIRRLGGQEVLRGFWKYILRGEAILDRIRTEQQAMVDYSGLLVGGR